MEDDINKVKQKSDDYGWAKRVIGGTSVATGIGATAGLVLGFAKGQPVKSFALPIAINFAIAGSFFAGMSEVTRLMLRTEPGAYINTIGGGIISGAALARLQGIAASPLSMGLLFAAAGTSCQFFANQWDDYKMRNYLEGLPDEAFPENIREARREMVEERNKEKSWATWAPVRKLSQEEFDHRAELARRMKLERNEYDE